MPLHSLIRSRLSQVLLQLLAGVLPATLAQAVTYQAGMNQAEWRLESSVFECRLWQPIPYYGDAVFRYRAGGSQQFYLDPTRPAMRGGQAALESKAPVWDEERRQRELGVVPVKEGQQPILLGDKLANRLLLELFEGMSPQFTRQSWYADDVSIKVGLSSVNFRRAYEQYRGCLAQLLPVNFDQIARSRVHFITDKSELTAEARQRLDIILAYVKADPSVTGFYVDGHTDDVGRRVHNLDLSKRRAETVTRYLVARGVDAALITTRYHGEALPAVPNSNAANRAQNRRVTLQLEREDF